MAVITLESKKDIITNLCLNEGYTPSKLVSHLAQHEGIHTNIEDIYNQLEDWNFKLLPSPKHTANFGDEREAERPRISVQCYHGEDSHVSSTGVFDNVQDTTETPQLFAYLESDQRHESLPADFEEFSEENFVVTAERRLHRLDEETSGHMNVIFVANQQENLVDDVVGERLSLDEGFEVPSGKLEASNEELEIPGHDPTSTTRTASTSLPKKSNAQRPLLFRRPGMAGNMEGCRVKRRIKKRTRRGEKKH